MSDSTNPIELMKAVLQKEDADGLRKLLEENPQIKAKINEPIFSFDSPAITLVRSRLILDVLLDAGADINARSTWWAGGFGLLDFADPQLSACAIERGATVDAHAAARLGLLGKLSELIAADPSLVHAAGGDGQTPLHFAGSIEVATFLLDRGADIDALDVDHESTPAQYMVRDRQPVAKFLVERGCKTDILMAAALGDVALVGRFLNADPASIRTVVGDKYFPRRNPRSGGTIYIWTLGSNKSAHQVARDFKHEDVYCQLMDRSSAELQLTTACEMGDEQLAASLLGAHPTLVHSLAEDDKKRLAFATQRGDLSVVRRMLAAGWPVNVGGQHAAMPLHWAAFHGNATMVKEILAHNPPLEDTGNEFQSTPLAWAVYGSENSWHCATGDYAATVDLLCKAGAKLPRNLGGPPAVRQVLERVSKERGA